MTRSTDPMAHADVRPYETPAPPATGWDRARAIVDRVLGRALVVLMAASVVNVLWQVATRFASPYIPGLQPSSFTDELARFLLIWVGVLGAAYASGQRMHLAIDLLPRALGGARKTALTIVIQVLVLVFALGALVYGGGVLVAVTFALEQTSASLRLPLGAVYTVLPLAGLLIAFYAVDEVRRLKLEVGSKES